MDKEVEQSKDQNTLVIGSRRFTAKYQTMALCCNCDVREHDSPPCHLISCTSVERHDKKDVIFVEVL